MKKLGKKAKEETKNLRAFAYCVCSNCPCGPTSQYQYTFQANYVDSERKA